MHLFEKGIPIGQRTREQLKSPPAGFEGGKGRKMPEKEEDILLKGKPTRKGCGGETVRGPNDGVSEVIPSIERKENRGELGEKKRSDPLLFPGVGVEKDATGALSKGPRIPPRWWKREKGGSINCSDGEAKVNRPMRVSCLSTGERGLPGGRVTGSFRLDQQRKRGR